MRRPFLFPALLVVFSGAAFAGVDLIAKSSIPGTATDRSGLNHRLENGVEANRLGGFGSAIAYTGRRDVFIALSDRGPNARPYDPAVDNTTSYANRIHTFRLILTRAASGAPLPFVLEPRLESTTLLRSKGVPLTGRADAFEPGRRSDWSGHARFDPEGLRVSNDRRSVYVADEYGPHLYRFNRQSGRRTGVFALPAYYGVDRPGPVGRPETAAHARGRVANRSMEGLAITPDGRTLVGMMQNPLIQDGGVGALPTRLIAFDTRSRRSREYVYRLESGDNLVSEILAVSAREFLVLERDGLEGGKAGFKRIYRIDISEAQDVSGADTLPASAQPVSKALFLDLLDPRHGLRGRDFPPRIEGLAFGPDLAVDGRRRRTLYVTSDNDYLDDEPSSIFVFAFDPADLENYRTQRFR
jgi:hypothetical protein